MKTIGEIVRLSIAHVQSKGGRPRHEVEELIAQTLSMRRLDLYLNFDRPLEEAEAAKIRGPLHLLASGKPLAYVLGKAHFYGFEFSVTPAVLIPRPETELLVTTAKAFMSSRSPGILVDVCTGSGCVGLTLKALFPDWHVVLTDISREALAVAKSNARRLNLTVDLLCGDLLKPFLRLWIIPWPHMSQK